MARTPYLLAHGPDTSAVATNPITVTQGTPSQLTGTINFAWSGNTFSQNVGAAEYYVDTPPWAGGTGIPMTGSFGSPTVAVQATVDTSSLSVGRHVLFVRGRGATDYLGYQTWGEVSAAWLWVTPNGGTPIPTGTPTRTNTPVPATNTPTRTSTSVPPTNTGQPTSTHTAAPTNTATPVNTPLPTQTAGGFTATPAPTDTNTAIPTGTSTDTPVTLTGTAIPPSNTPAATDTPSGIPSATPTACTLTFTDVPVGSTFYPFIRCLACKGIINGYPDGTFRPGNNVTRGQLSKIVSNSAGFSDNQTTQMFRDVPVGSTFYQYIGRLASRGFINGYPCSAPPAGHVYHRQPTLLPAQR